MPVNCTHQFCSAGAHQAFQAQNLSGMQGEGNILQNILLGIKGMTHRQMLNPQQFPADFCVLLGIHDLKAVADHFRHHLREIHLINAVRRHCLTVTQNIQAVTDGEHLVHLMGNQNNGDSLLFQKTHGAEKHSDFLLGQCCRGFVQNQNPGIFPQRMSDADHLLFRIGQIAHFLPGIQMHLQSFQNFFRFSIHSGPVNEAALFPFPVAEENILCTAHIQVYAEFLINHCDTCIFRVLCGAEALFFSVDENLALIGTRRISSTDNLHQGGFSCTVFTDDAQDFSCFDLEIHIIKRCYAGETLGNMFEFHN